MMNGRRVGITSTVPIEVIFASGSVALDLNNAFIGSGASPDLVERAERKGFPESSCAWIKGIYSAVHANSIDTVIAVTQGDCSNTHALMETLEFEGIPSVPFMYPYDRDRRFLGMQIEKLCGGFGVELADAVRVKGLLDGIRRDVAEIDRLTWEEGTVGGFENHYYLVSCSDMKGDPEAFSKEVRDFLREAGRRKPRSADLRLGYVGIPPIMSGIHNCVESQGGAVVFNELQRQFSMPQMCDDIVDQYLVYTYPYHIRFRLEDIKAEIRRREIDGVIHYVQAFCFRQIEDIILRKVLDVPVLTIEGNRPHKLDLRSQIRIEAFLDMLRSLRD
jgi:benzoyl-CoA reductase/2-hydroxyglutaryl-CoA dehydratase subunit BcrC/BadD/HgdB